MPFLLSYLLNQDNFSNSIFITGGLASNQYYVFMYQVNFIKYKIYKNQAIITNFINFIDIDGIILYLKRWREQRKKNKCNLT